MSVHLYRTWRVRVCGSAVQAEIGKQQKCWYWCVSPHHRRHHIVARCDGSRGPTAVVHHLRMRKASIAIDNDY